MEGGEALERYGIMSLLLGGDRSDIEYDIRYLHVLNVTIKTW